MKSFFVILLLLSTVIIGAAFMPPAELLPKNLKVLPNDITREELHKIMVGFKDALGVKCGFCHASAKGDSTHLDFASDDKPEKEMARHMMKMTMMLNSQYFNGMKTETGGMVQISCITCHNGKIKPVIKTDSTRFNF